MSLAANPPTVQTEPKAPAKIPVLSAPRHNLADLLRRKGDNSQAEGLFRACLKTRPVRAPGLQATGFSAKSCRPRALTRRSPRDFKHALNHLSTITSLENLAALLEKAGKFEESLTLRDRYIERMAGKRDSASVLSLRRLALQFYIRRDYRRAEELLRVVLDKNLEVPSNRCHLARLLILTDRELDARGDVVKAWERRTEGEDYVVPRIVPLQALFLFLDGSTPSQHFANLKFLLKRESAFSEWKIQPALDHLKTRLSPNAFDLLQTLATVLGDRKKLSDLDRFSEWRDVQPLESPSSEK